MCSDEVVLIGSRMRGCANSQVYQPDRPDWPRRQVPVSGPLPAFHAKFSCQPAGTAPCTAVLKTARGPGNYSAYMGRGLATAKTGRRYLLPILLCAVFLRAAVAELYKPPTQRAVAVKVINGVLLAEGSIEGAPGKPAVAGLFVVDTAATTTLVSPDTARLLGGRGTSGEKLADTTLKLAGAQVSHRPAMVYSVEAFAKQTGQRVIGIAGSDIFENFGARIDYVHQTLTLVVLQSCATPDVHVHLKVINGLPFVEAILQTASGQQVHGIFLVDTGQAGSGLVLTSEFLKAHPELGSPSQPIRIAGFSLGGHVLKDVPARVAPPSPRGVGAQLAGVVSGSILSRFDVMVDLPGSWMMLTPNDHYGDPFGADAH